MYVFSQTENPFKIGELKILRSRSDEMIRDLLVQICEYYYVNHPK